MSEPWVHPTECPAEDCDGKLEPWSVAFVYICSEGHVWQKEQFWYGHLHAPWRVAIRNQWVEVEGVTCGHLEGGNEWRQANEGFTPMRSART